LEKVGEVISANPELKEVWPTLDLGKQSELLRLITNSVTVGQSEVQIEVSKARLSAVREQKLWECEAYENLEVDDVDDNETVKVNVPVVIKKNGSEKVIVLSGADVTDQARGPNADLIKCIVRAQDWVKRMQSGELTSVKEIVGQTGMNPKYVARMLKAAFLAPDITEAILDGCQPAHLTVIEILKPFPMLWSEQRQHFGFA